jgi:eukaryotic-like serine/threonine-protein kinase
VSEKRDGAPTILSPPDRWHEVDALFQRVLEVPPSERAIFLDGSCAGDEALRAGVESLVRAADRSASFLETSVEDCCAVPWPEIFPPRETAEGAGGDALPPERTGERVGRYRLLRGIGRGGMANVYLAERADGQFEQRVAIKLLRRGLDTDDVVRRFVSERQILSSLSHPNIARLLDGGATEDGLPYLVMEHVEGVPLTAWCDERRLPVPDRLRLFCDVARAVHHAHQHLVVHRDLKPSNILVDAEGRVKLLDFGIARLLEPEDAHGTRTILPPLTPEYASPEQIRGETTTTGSDIYQLGILLCQLLSGRRPYELRVLSPAALVRAVAAATPARPSDLVTEASAHARGARTRELRRALRGDLDAITLKALRPEPDARFESCSELVRDIEQHLAGRPVTARRASILYGARKLVTRRPWLLPAVAAIVLAAGAHVATLRRHASQLQEERNVARAEAAVSAEMADFLADLFMASSPLASTGIRTVNELVDFGIVRVDSLVDRPEIRSRLLGTLGHSAYWLGQLETARSLLQRAVELGERAGDGTDPSAGWWAGQYLGAAHYALGDYAAAEAAYRTTLDRYRPVLGARSPAVGRTLNVLGWLYHETGDLDRAESAYRDAFAIHRDSSGADSPEYASALENLGLLHADRGEYGAAEALVRQALDVRRAALAPDHPNLAFALRSLGRVLYRRGEREAGEALLREALNLRQVALGPDHHKYAEDLAHLAAALAGSGDIDEARRLLERALAIRQASLGESHPVTLVTRHQLGALLHQLGDTEAAETLYRSADTGLARSVGEEHPWTRAVADDLGRLHAGVSPAPRDWLSGTRVPLPHAGPHAGPAGDLARRHP